MPIWAFLSSENVKHFWILLEAMGFGQMPIKKGLVQRGPLPVHLTKPQSCHLEDSLVHLGIDFLNLLIIKGAF
jgi:hypothetical protein